MTMPAPTPPPTRTSSRFSRRCVADARCTRRARRRSRRWPRSTARRRRRSSLAASGSSVQLHVGRGEHDAVIVDDAGRRAADAEQRALEAAGDVACQAHDRPASPSCRSRRCAACERRSTILPARLTTAASITSSSLRSRAMTWRPSGSTPSSVAGLPALVLALRPTSPISPSAISSAVTADTVVGGEPAVAGEVGAALRTVGVERLQQQRPVARTGVRRRCLRRRRRATVRADRRSPGVPSD